jgi:hypothetical protein
MSYLEQSLSAGEKVERVFRLHWSAWLPVWIWALLVITLPIALYVFLRLKFQEQGVLGRIFGFGTVKVTGRGLSDIVFKGLDDPIAVKRTIESIHNPVD